MGLLDRFRGRPPRRNKFTLNFPYNLYGGYAGSVTGTSGLLRSDGYYAIQQTEYDIRVARQYTQTDGYGREIVEIFIDTVVGATGIRVVWGDAYVQKKWDAWRWNTVRSHERIDEVQRDVVRGVVRDGESIVEIQGDAEGIYLANLDPIDLPLTVGAPYSRLIPRSRTVQGIKFDDQGAPCYIGSDPSTAPVTGMAARSPGTYLLTRSYIPMRRYSQRRLEA